MIRNLTCPVKTTRTLPPTAPSIEHLETVRKTRYVTVRYTYIRHVTVDPGTLARRSECPNEFARRACVHRVQSASRTRQDLLRHQRLAVVLHSWSSSATGAANSWSKILLRSSTDKTGLVPTAACEYKSVKASAPYIVFTVTKNRLATRRPIAWFTCVWFTVSVVRSAVLF